MRISLFLSAMLFLGACEERFSLENPETPAQSGDLSYSQSAAPSPVSSAGPLRLAMVGPYMDAQERDFRTHLKGFVVRRVGDDLVVSIADSLLFDDEALSDHGSDTIETIARLLRHYDRSYVEVLGYTDTSLSPGEAVVFTDGRARIVANALVEDGVAKPRVSAEGFGAARLKVATGPGRREPRNRRVEIRVVANPQG